MAKFCPECGNPLVSETSKFCDKCGANTSETNTDRQKKSDQEKVKTVWGSFTTKQKVVNVAIALSIITICFFVIFFVFGGVQGFSQIFENFKPGLTSGSSGGSGSTCSPGYYVYTTSAGKCCPEGYPYYYDGKCHQCSQGYFTYSTSGGKCCREGYPYYYNGVCNSQPSSSNTGASPNMQIGSRIDVQIDSRTGCPPYNDLTNTLECSQWIQLPRCAMQSCTCYWSGLHGDTSAAYYHTSDNAYYRCTGSDVTIFCTAAAQEVVQHCA